jgi:hypothetical protein
MVIDIILWVVTLLAGWVLGLITAKPIKDWIKSKIAKW